MSRVLALNRALTRRGICAYRSIQTSRGYMTSANPSTIQNDQMFAKDDTRSQEIDATTSFRKMMSLEQRTTIITGGARGLGATLASAVLEAGGDVVCLDVLPKPGEVDWNTLSQLSEASKQHLSYHQCDITKQESVATVLAEVASSATQRGKPVRGLVHAAGIQQMIDAIDYPIDGFRRILEVNVTGSFLMAQHVARIMKSEGNPGSIVLVASMSGQIANRGIHCTAYNTSKAAVHQMCRSLAVEFGKFGVRVNTLSPGYIRTAMTDMLLEEKPELEETWMRGALLGRLGYPADFKVPTIYMLTDGSSFMTGADLRVDGGHCASA